jgi:hypothetical protein
MEDIMEDMFDNILIVTTVTIVISGTMGLIWDWYEPRRLRMQRSRLYKNQKPPR